MNPVQPAGSNPSGFITFTYAEKLLAGVDWPFLFLKKDLIKLFDSQALILFDVVGLVECK